MPSRKNYNTHAKDPRQVCTDLTTRTGRYFLARQHTKTRKEALGIAGYGLDTTPKQIESSKTYKAIEQLYYKDELLKKMTLSDIADEQVKVIKQDKELGAKNKAIEMALKKLDPEDNHTGETNNVLIVLK